MKIVENCGTYKFTQRFVTALLVFNEPARSGVTTSSSSSSSSSSDLPLRHPGRMSPIAQEKACNVANTVPSATC